MGRITPTAPAAPSAKPGTKDVAAQKPEKKAKVKRTYYPGLEPKTVMVDGKPKLSKKGKEIVRPSKKLDAVPTDFDIKQHRPLGKNDFADESMYWTLRAQDLRKKADAFDKKAADIKQYGANTDKKSASQLVKMQDRMSELLAQLAGKGVDVDAVMAKLKASAEEKVKAKAAETQTAAA
jgi:hypothetical protein